MEEEIKKSNKKGRKFELKEFPRPLSLWFGGVYGNLSC